MFSQQKRLSWELEIQQLIEKIKESRVRSATLKARFKDHHLLAPADGILEQVGGLEIGAMVQAGQAVGTISPDGGLIIENNVLPKDISWIKVGQAVRFHFDAFPYQEWGMLEGFVTEIDQNITLENNRAYFRVFCGIEKNQSFPPQWLRD